MKLWFKDLLLLTIVVGVFFGATLGRYPMSSPDGARYAEIPREMVATGDYITPHLNGIKYFEKPPLFYWLQALSIKAFGVNDLAVSIPNACLALLCVLGIYLTGRRFFGRLAGLLGGLVFATSGLVFVLTRIVTLDMALTFFLTGALCSFLFATQLPRGNRRSWCLWSMYCFGGCAVMSKGLVGIVFLGLIVGSWILLYDNWRNWHKYCLGSGMLIMLAITVPWHILVQLKNPEFFHFYFIEQHFLRYLTNYAGRAQAWWFFPAALLGGWYPWVTFLGQSIIYNYKTIFKTWRHNQTLVFLGLWISIIYGFYTISNSKLIPYILPIFPPLALLIGRYLAIIWQDNKHKYRASGFYIFAILNCLLGISGIIASFYLDFNFQSFTRENLYVLISFMFITALLVPIVYHRFNAACGIGVLTAAVVGLLLYTNTLITVIYCHSIKPLITVLQERLRPTDTVIAYGYYYQDLPFYLERIIHVVDYTDELYFGTQHQDTSSWMINADTFWQHWQSKEPVYLIIDGNKYRALAPQAFPQMKIIAEYMDTFLVAKAGM